jgi:DNA primase
LYPGKPFEEFGSQIVLTEGIFDALTVNQLSDKQALCTFGHKISAGQIQILKDIGTKSVILAWDYDSKKAMESAAKNLEMHGMQTKVFPFSHNDYWKNYDLGAMITSGMSWPIDKMQEMLLNELANPISCYDTKFLEWWMS